MFHKFALTYNQIEQILRIFGVLSEGRAPSSEYSLNPENSLYPQAGIRIGRSEELGGWRDARKTVLDRGKLAVYIFTIILIVLSSTSLLSS